METATRETLQFCADLEMDPLHWFCTQSPIVLVSLALAASGLGLIMVVFLMHKVRPYEYKYIFKAWFLIQQFNVLISVWFSLPSGYPPHFLIFELLLMAWCQRVTSLKYLQKQNYSIRRLSNNI